MKTAWWAAAALAVAACGQGGGATSDDPYAGLDAAVKDWREAIVTTDAACARKAPEGEACQQFEVTCKVESPIGPAERSAGVTQKVLAAMTWTAHDPARGEQAPASATATFAKAGGGWTRAAAEPVNLRTCAPF